jgi:hypothetical protein
MIKFRGILLGICIAGICVPGRPADKNREFRELNRFYAAEARQGVAVDESHIYVIATRAIGKYEKSTGKLIKVWQGGNSPIIHLDSGVIHDGRLYCAHSNYPDIPMTSSVEIWDAETLEHIGSHSFGIRWGSCTWIDRFDEFWWGVFAHYDKWKMQAGKGVEWTTLIKLDNNWNYLQSWTFPEEVLRRFTPMSNSGGSWGPDSLLYCTGHDSSEVYLLRVPEMGSVLDLIDVIEIEILGQGIAWDRTDEGVLYGIRREDRQIVVSRRVR